MASNTLEIAVTSLYSAQLAAQSGADRLELCDNLEQGGITPSAGKIKLAKASVAIPVFVLIRPRKADFFYSDDEFAVMLEDIKMAKTHGADGIVSGVLQANGKLDLERTEKLIAAATPLPFTFHRAFDMCENSSEALEQLIDLKVDRILTSGRQPSAIAGKAQIAQFIQQAKGRIEIMAGGGIKPETLKELVKIEGLCSFHASAKRIKKSRMQYLGEATMGSENIEQEFSWLETDGEMIKQMSRFLKK